MERWPGNSRLWERRGKRGRAEADGILSGRGGSRTWIASLGAAHVLVPELAPGTTKVLGSTKVLPRTTKVGSYLGSSPKR